MGCPLSILPALFGGLTSVLAASGLRGRRRFGARIREGQWVRRIRVYGDCNGGAASYWRLPRGLSLFNERRSSTRSFPFGSRSG